MRRTLLYLLLLAAAAAGRPQAPAFVPRPLAELVAEARAATPPVDPKATLAPALVDVAALDPSLRLDIRYATKDNFLGAAVYDAARAFLQRPVAEALLRAHRALLRNGYALRIHDAYRPWWVTKVFWEATEPAKRAFVANPAKGSVHNRGGAVDVSLVRAADDAEVEMPSGYDEFSERAHPAYAGGSAAARRNRDLLRAAMEAEGFTVEKEEWWHFDHASARQYPVLNVPFEAVAGPSPDLDRAGQVLLVTTAGWDRAEAELQRFERGADGSLAPVGAPLRAWVGKGGLGWRTDAGAPAPPAPGPRKREGDGKAPAGILGFGEMRGYDARPPEGVRLPYRDLTDCDRCVDDAEHADYNRILRLPDPKSPVTWKSAEVLRMASEHYRWLVVVRYNDREPRKGAGSCIFLHVAPPPGGGTAGCTALAAEDLLALLRWMDPARHPVMVQLPAPAIAAAQAAWSLPAELRPPRKELEKP